MTEPVLDGPTDPNLAGEESTTVITRPGYGGPAPAGPAPGRPPVPAPAGPPAAERSAGGRLYATGEPRPAGTPGLADRGRTTISTEVVERVIGKVVDVTAAEVPGVQRVYRGPGGEAGTATATATATGTDAGAEAAEVPAGGVSVRLDDAQAVIDLAIEVQFGHAVHEVVESVRASIISQAERLLGLTVTEVNVLVAGVVLDPPER